MSIRSTSSLVRFSHPFTLPGVPGVLPAGMYEVVGEDEILRGADFETFRRTETFLLVRGPDRSAGRGARCPVSEADLRRMLARDRAASVALTQDLSALGPQEDCCRLQPMA